MTCKWEIEVGASRSTAWEKLIFSLHQNETAVANTNSNPLCKFFLAISSLLCEGFSLVLAVVIGSREGSSRTRGSLWRKGS